MSDLERITINDHGRFIAETQVQLDCLALIEGITGTVEAFLNVRQPDFEGMTGRQLLEDRPTELLERLRQLERGEG